MIAVSEVERMETEEPCYYTPGRVRYWLEHWRELQELAIPSAGGLRTDIPNMAGGYGSLVGMHYSEIIADLERATLAFHRWTLHFLICESLMRGDDLVSLARSLRVMLNDADRAMTETCEVMARQLGWGE